MSDIAGRIAKLSADERKLLARRLAERQKEKPLNSLSRSNKAQTEPLDTSHQLSPVQQVYWIGRSGLYDLSCCGSNIYTEFEITGVDAAFLGHFNRALDRLTDRHEMLRAVVLPNGRQRIIASAPRYELKCIDLRGQEPQSIEKQIELVRHRMRTEKAPIDRWPLFEFLVHRLDDERFRFHIRIEALLLDGTSRGILLGELFQLASDPDTELPGLAVSYLDYVEACARQRDKLDYQVSRDYWLSRIDRLPPAPELPLTQPINPQTASVFSNRSYELLGAEELIQLKARCVRAGLTASAVVTAAFLETAALWSRNAQFTLGIVGSYRPPIHSEIRKIIGNFNTLFLVESDLRQDSFEARARRLQEQLLTNLEYRHFSGFEVLRKLNRKRRSAPKSGMPVLFNCVLESKHFSRWRISDGEEDQPALREIDGSLYMPQVVFIPTVLESSDGFLIGKWQAVDHLFPDTLLQRILNCYQSLLRSLANDEEAWHRSTRELLGLASPSNGIPTERTELLSRTSAHSTLDKEFQTQSVPVEAVETLEMQIGSVWKDLLSIESVAASDNFFDLGGDSFLAVCLMNRLRGMFGEHISLSGFLEEPTVRELAHILRQQLAGRTTNESACGAAFLETPG